MRKVLAAALAAMMTLSAGAGVSAAEKPSVGGTLALYIGSPLTMTQEGVRPLDPGNPNVAPIIHRDRTLVPVRAIAEHFGSDVSYDAARRAAVIAHEGKVYYFYIGKSYFTSVDARGSEIRHAIDTESLIREDRSMVPLRAICEQVLGLEVRYARGAILVGVAPADIEKDLKAWEAIHDRIGQAVKIASLDQLAALMSSGVRRYGPEIRVMVEKAMEPADAGIPMPSAAPENAQTSGSGAEPSYSATTIQVEGIDEADVVKTDGKFIYAAGGSFISIIRADDGSMRVADVIRMPDADASGARIQVSELYVDKGRLIVLGSVWQDDFRIMPMTDGISAPDVDGIAPMIYPPIRQNRPFTYCGVYSVNDGGQADLIRELKIEGTMLSSRKNGDTVYLTANKYVYYYPERPADLLPVYVDSAAGGALRSLPAEKIMHYPENPYPQYMIIAALDIRDPSKEATVEAILGSGSNIYMNDSALYIASTDYDSRFGETTGITKFTIDGLKIGYAGGGRVPGSIVNQFSMDEHEGDFRIATTSWSMGSSSGLYILDGDFEQIGAIEGIAPGERIYSVRLMGDKGYIVTFRQIDPLFVLDLSDPERPAITGELKVPGFSNYLYPVGEDLLMGVGQDTQDVYARDASGKETVIGTIQTGIKFSLFDVSDQGKPKELHNYVLGGTGSYSEILGNHKALMFDPERGRIAFEAAVTDTGISGKVLSNYFTGAILIDYDKDDGFDLDGRIAYKPSTIQDPDGRGYYAYIRRLCYIGDVLYYVQDGMIRSFDYDTLAPISAISIWK